MIKNYKKIFNAAIVSFLITILLGVIIFYKAFGDLDTIKDTSTYTLDSTLWSWSLPFMLLSIVLFAIGLISYVKNK